MKNAKRTPLLEILSDALSHHDGAPKDVRENCKCVEKCIETPLHERDFERTESEE